MNLGRDFVMMARGETMPENREIEKPTTEEHIEYLEGERDHLQKELADINRELEELYQLRDSRDHQDTIESNRPGLF